MHVSWIDEGQYHFDFKADAAIFRYWDATACVEFGFQMAAQALDVELKQETAFLARFDEIARRVNARFDVRGNDLATLITLCLDNGGALSARKRKRYAHRVPAAAFDAIEAAAREVLSTPALPRAAPVFTSPALQSSIKR